MNPSAKYCFVGTNTQPLVEPSELILVQEICCVEEYHEELIHMITCQVVLSNINRITLPDIILRCSKCGRIFSDINLLKQHKISSKL